MRVFVRQGADLTTLHCLKVEYFYGDLLDEQKLLDACRGCDFVIHSGGKTAGHQTKFSDFAINIKGTQNIVHAAESAGIIRMVHVSSCCVFGGGTMENPGTELSEFAGFKFNSGYINSKYLAQQWVLSEVEKKGFPIVIVNPSLMIGPYDSRPSSGEMILRALRQQYQLCPGGGKNFIDVRDVATATCNALTMGIPGRLLNCAGLMGNAIQAMTQQDMPLNLVNTRQLTNRSYFSGNKAVRALDLPQRPVDNAIRDAIAWFVANKYLEPDVIEESIIPAVA